MRRRPPPAGAAGRGAGHEAASPLVVVATLWSAELLVRAAGRGRREIDGAMASLGLRSAHVLLLALLADAGALSQVEIARRLHLDAGTVGTLADALEQLGLVERSRDPRDRRY